MWRYLTSGIPDENFIRGNIPMTKEEIRTLSISKLRLGEKDIIWDIGAGTGSLSIEAALIAKAGTVYSIEKEAEAINLIKKNIEKFNVKNVFTIFKEAPEALEDLPSPDRIFIGGTGEKMYDVFECVKVKLKTNGIIVINSITLDTAYNAEKYFKDKGFKVETICVNISVSKEAGNKTMMKARNPVYIISVKNEG
ncbi:MAG: precorrin-6Y C5,15-methyltransferase (decarboxylating) subunit CbiT [Thermoanaerobacteraceae bacterium]